MLLFNSGVILFLCSAVTYAAFTRPITDPDIGTIIQSARGTFCFQPTARSELPPAGQTELICTSIKNDPSLELVFAQQLLNATTSINYYHAPEGGSVVRLGGANFTLRLPPIPTYLCVSGQASDGEFVTRCATTFMDDDFGGPIGCEERSVAQVKNDDGCYTPPEGPPPTSSPTFTRVPVQTDRVMSSADISAPSIWMIHAVCACLGLVFIGASLIQ
ncbi:hypothetical protein FA15DRAFT_672496 [Coprinopsis marcescibilis]|uniref:Uncharacterized protein n=1 Tax=Coprinopsis marcescibilis TaxID=230819 RepID=A0A5C3KMR2_COPMA|nr:hypothetical protein FA15DRAFT_672496 [Coprinopsis marcescibilis]